MKTKTISKTIKAKIGEWLKSITDKPLREKLKSEVIVTGGCIASMLLKEDVNDYDLYLQSKETVIEVVKYYLKLFTGNEPQELKTFKDEDGFDKIDWNNNGVGYMVLEDRVKVLIKSSGILREDDTKEGEKEKYRVVCLTSNAITLSDKIQIIIRFYGNPKEIHSNYDYIHATNYWCDGKIELNKEALESLITKELRYSGSKYPLCSIMRSKKFVQRGWTINAGQYLKMAMQLNELDLKDIETLEEQLIGVDSAYFSAVISCLRAKDQKNVDTSYLMTIIDQIF